MVNKKNKKDEQKDSDTFFSFARFFVSTISLVSLAIFDLYSQESISGTVYLMLGALNGVDIYKLIKDNTK